MPVVVVESPAKAKTINKYLGTDYSVFASYGHVRDLPPKDGSVDPSLLGDPNQARLIAQCDVKDGVGQLVNFNFDEDLLAAVPTSMVNGADDGIQHSFQVLNDAFAQQYL